MERAYCRGGHNVNETVYISRGEILDFLTAIEQRSR